MRFLFALLLAAAAIAAPPAPRLARAGHGAAYLRNEPVTVEATALGEGKWKWKSIALYDGAVRLGAITRHQPRLVLPAQKPGAHAGVLVGELPNGDLRTSLPVSWVVWP